MVAQSQKQNEKNNGVLQRAGSFKSLRRAGSNTSLKRSNSANTRGSTAQKEHSTSDFENDECVVTRKPEPAVPSVWHMFQQIATESFECRSCINTVRIFS